MKFIADLHIHSKYSRATSKDMTLEELDRWADDKRWKYSFGTKVEKNKFPRFVDEVK